MSAITVDVGEPCATGVAGVSSCPATTSTPVDKMPAIIGSGLVTVGMLTLIVLRIRRLTPRKEN